MYIKVSDLKDAGTTPIKGTCPHCGLKTTFDSIGREDLQTGDRSEEGAFYYLLGQRTCANAECRGHVFFILAVVEDDIGKPTPYLQLYPPQRISFDKSGIPDEVLASFEEAIGCLSHKFYRASAIMVRRTLEVLCDEQGATGDKLYDRINQLSKKGGVPEKFFKSLHNIRLFGNAAAHPEARFYKNIGEQEVTLSIKVTIQLLHAVYQSDKYIQSFEKLKEVDDPEERK